MEIVLFHGESEKLVAQLHEHHALIVEYDLEALGDALEASAFSVSYEDMQKILLARGTR